MSNFDPDEFIRKYGDAPTEDEEGASLSTTPILDTEPKKEETVAAAGSLGGFNPDEFIKKYGGEPKKQAEGGGDYLARQAEYLMSRQPLDTETQLPAEPRDNSWDTLRGLEVSMRQVPQLAYGVAGLVGETAEQLTGYGESLRDFGFKGYQDWAQSMEPISKETDDVTVAWQRAKEGDVGALVDWAQYGIGYALGQLGETAAVAVLGGIAGGATAAPAGPAAVPAAVGGAVVAAAGKQGFKSLAKNLVEKAIANQANKIVINQAKKEGVELTAEQVAKRAQQEAIKRQAGKEIGSNAAVFANAIGMQLGSIYGSAEEQARAEGRELTGVDLARIWGTGVATGGIEGVVDKFGLDLLKGKLSDKLPAGRLAGAAVAGGVGTLGEAVTEAVQTVGERFGAGKDILSDEAINEYINASALGGLGGGAIGGVGGFISGNPKENAAAKAKVSSEANREIAPATAETVARQADAVIAETVQETPEQRVARLQEEATAAAGIELEEEAPVSGLPPQPVTPPVVPTAEGAVAPVEPVVEPVSAEPQPAAEVAPEAETVRESLKTGVEVFHGGRLPETITEVRAFGGLHTGTQKAAEERIGRPSEAGQPTEVSKIVVTAENPYLPEGRILDEGNGADRTQLFLIQQLPEERQKLIDAGYDVIPYKNAIEDPNSVSYLILDPRGYTREGDRYVKKPAAEAAPAVTPPAEVAPQTPNLEPLRRVARAEQAPEDVPSLLDAGLVEVYKDQPVLTEAGIAQLPEAERPRLNPEARKIQIDTGSNEVVAEAIAKGLRIGVDQVGFNVRMPAGWVLDGDIYVPPTPQEVAPEVRESRREPAPLTQQDREYLDAVERGDLDAGSKAVDKAAKAAGYTQRWFHGTAAKDFNVFRDFGRKFIYFTQTRGDAMDWAKNNVEYARPEYAQGETPTPRVVEAFINADNIFNRTNEEHMNRVVDFMSKSDDRSVKNQTPQQLKESLLEENYEWYEEVAYKFIRQAGFDGAYIFESQDFDPYNLEEADLGILNPNLIKSAEPVTRDNQGNVIPLSQRFQPTEEDIRYNPLGYDITTVVEDIKAGRKDGPLRAVNNVIKQSQELRDRIQREAARRQEPRARGKAAILDRLSRERASGRISEETAQALTDFVNRIREDAIGDTALSIRKGGVSNFNFGETLVSFFLNQDQPATGARVGIHEFFHGLSRFLPDAEVEQMRQDYTKNLAEYLQKNPWFLAFVGRYSLTPEQFEEYKLFNPKEAETKLQPVKDRDGKIVKYQIKYDADNYRYIMLDEWIAEKMTDLVRSKQAVPDTFMGKIAKVIRDFLDLIKAKLGKDVYESFYQTITDPKQKLNLYRMSSVAEPFQIYQPQNFNYAEDVLDRIRYTRTERDPIITQAAMDLKDGKIDRDEYQRIVDLRMPLTKFESIPIPASNQDMLRGLGERKAGEKLKKDLVKSPESIAGGTIIESRLDIPAYENENVWVVSMHKPRPNLQKGSAGEVIAYSPTAVLRNVEFGVTEPAAINIAAGKPKSTIATMKGSYVPMTSQEAYDLANRGRSEGWVEIGMNPIRHSYFYDKDTQSPVVSAEEVVQVGGMVLAKNPVYGKRDDYRFMALGGEQAGRFPTFETTSPEAATLSTMAASMAKVDTASEAKPNPENKPTYKISEIASVWMDQGGDVRQLQDLISENTNLTPTNAAKVANAIAKQYGIQQQLVEAAAPLTEITPEAEGAPRKSSVTKLIEQTTGVRKPVVKIQVSESAALKKQIQLKAREARETRKARKEAAEDLAKSITDYVKANPIRGPINSRQAMSITKRALKLDVNNEAAVDRFEMYVERVIENANYDQDLADARALIKRAKTFAKSKETQGNVKTTLDAIANISPTLLDNPFEFNLVVQRYLLGLAPVTAKRYAVMPDADVRRYLESLETQISANQDILNRSKAQRILDGQVAYAEEKGIPLDEAIAILNSEEYLNNKTVEKLEDLTQLLTSMAQESQKDVRAYDDSGSTPKQKELISFMRKVGLDSLDNEQKKRYIRFSNNLLANGATFGMEQFQSIALGQESVVKALKDKRLSNRLSAWISPIGGDKAIDTARKIALRTQSEADTFKNIFGREAVGAFRKILGLNRLDIAQTDSNRAKEQIANEFGEYFKGLRKKYGDDATGFEAKGYAGIAGYLIQTDGIKTEAESIPYRRRLMEQNIVELRKSDKQADLAEADLKERALVQLTGASNAEILSQLQALNPASYEQLMWVKDTMLPKWRDFLKEHDENFRNQANNYNNPDHLTITYKFPEGQLLPNEIEDVYQQDAIGMRIKQAANSIKRKEHSSLPVSPRTGTVANIDINFGYNQYNALVDQVDKAYVAPAWEQVVAFTKDQNFEQVVGGRANATFVKKLLTDIQTSRTRQSMTDDESQMVAGGVRLARKISTQAVLGGFTQPLRQVPDQLTKLFLTTGRWDLITKNLLKIAEAAPLMNKFPIGRRGDAQAGTQYASQFSELARKVEASVTDRKWAQYRELMNRVGEFWMAPLRGSDVWAAKVSWMSYYEAYLNKQDIKMESWEREAELVETDDVRKEAASYAEFAVDFYGGASDPTKMASLSKQTNNGWKEFAKLLFLPLNSFALQQKNSLISDLRDAYLRTGDRKASVAAISGTLAGMAAFHGMRIYIIGGLVYPAGKALLMGIFGIDMDEPDEEEKQKQLEDNWRKFKASMYGNIVAGGAGEFVEKAAIDAFNKTAYLWDANINPDALLNDKGEIMTFRQYEKDVSPLYRFRSYGPSEYSFGLADVLTEQATHALSETQQLLSPEEMERYTGNEQAYAAFATGVEWMYFFRLMDTDVNRIAKDLKRQMDKQVEEREKEIKAIRGR